MHITTDLGIGMEIGFVYFAIRNLQPPTLNHFEWLHQRFRQNDQKIITINLGVCTPKDEYITQITPRHMLKRLK